MTKLFIPGKLFLAGEYAITNPGNTAIIATTDIGLSITIQHAQGQSSVVTSNVIKRPLHFDLNNLNFKLNDEWRYVESAIQMLYYYATLHDLELNHPVSIKIVSNMNSKSGKIGLGSSAAVVVGIIEALNHHFDLKLSLMKRFKLAGLAHLHVQKNGSLGDIAAITYGGVIAYQSPNLFKQNHSKNDWLNPELVDKNWPNLSITSLVWPEKWRIILAATLESADTKFALENFSMSKQMICESKIIVQNIIKAINAQDYMALTTGLECNQNLLKSQLPLGYITPKLDFFLSTIHELPGKISGAGFGDNGFVVLESKQYDSLEKLWHSRQIVSHQLVLSQQKRG